MHPQFQEISQKKKLHTFRRIYIGTTITSSVYIRKTKTNRATVWQSIFYSKLTLRDLEQPVDATNIADYPWKDFDADHGSSFHRWKYARTRITHVYTYVSACLTKRNRSRSETSSDTGTPFLGGSVSLEANGIDNVTKWNNKSLF